MECRTLRICWPFVTYWYSNTTVLSKFNAYNRKGDVAHEVVLGYLGTFIDWMSKSFQNPSTWPWKLDPQDLFWDVPEYQNCTGVVSSSMDYSTSISVSIISSYQNISKPHIERDSLVDNVILGNNKKTTFHSCHRKETSTNVCTIKSSVKGTDSKHRI